MAHSHPHHEPNPKNILFSVLLNGIITLAEFIGGFLSNSLALISDAVHNLSDTMAIFISYIALKIGKKDSNSKNTFGYKRIEILTALFNAVILISISFYLFFEAYKRFLNPEPIESKLMFIVATIGLIGNVVSVILLHKDSSHNLNIRSAYLHLIGDTLSSVGVIIGSILIYFWNITWIDPLLTILIGIVIIKATRGIIKETINILMQASPKSLNLDQIINELEKHPDIKNIHHIHAWSLSDNLTHFQCHADLIENKTIKEVDSIRLELENILHSKFKIDHITIQMEYDTCYPKPTLDSN